MSPSLFYAYIFVITFTLIKIDGRSNADKNSVKNILITLFGDTDIVKESFLETPELVAKHGYPCESHKVTTEDGYILTMHRIPAGRRNHATIESDRVPVVLTNPLLSTSANWVVDGPERALALILADAGFDVWLGNFRGNRYSRRHIILDPDKDVRRFWDFSCHENGVYDLKAMVDKVLSISNHSALHLFGYSHSASAVCAMASTHVDYKDKLRTLQLMAPSVFVKHISYFSNNFTANINVPILQEIVNILEIHEILPNNPKTVFLIHLLLNEKSIFRSIALNVYLSITRSHTKYLDVEKLPMYMSHMFSGNSFKQILHLLQMLKSYQFAQYDHGVAENLRVYGTEKPAVYNLRSITSPTFIYNSKEDGVVSLLDVSKLQRSLGNARPIYKVKLKRYDHIAYMHGNNNKILYDRIIKVLQAH